MPTRRGFIVSCLKRMSFLSLCGQNALLALSRACADSGKRVVPRETPRENLVNEKPSELDTSQLELTPLDAFGSMGQTDKHVELASWRLIVDGNVDRPLELDYGEVLKLPSIQRAVILICPGIFVNHGLWKGVSIRVLLEKAGVKPDANYITTRGPQQGIEKVDRFPFTAVENDQVFLAYSVNGKTLPVKHGFPLRVVAEGYYGDRWLKYAYKLTAEHIEKPIPQPDE
jgi:DMSO/TMAO reductase YedYZ molybdopterin-dependent catalytic subunit